jgi:hypothetical protein
MLRAFLNRPVGTPEYDARLAELGAGIAGFGIMGVGIHRISELELDEPARLLGFAATLTLGLVLVAIGQLGGLKVRLAARR